MSWAIPAIALAVCVSVVPAARSQQLEPRAYANSPTGMTFALAGYGYSDGDVVLEGSAPLEDGKITSNSLVLAFARSLSLFGDGGKIDVVVPYAWTLGTATFAGEPQRRDVDGFGDPTARLTWNFVGAPALTLPEYRHYQPDWIVGASFNVGMPLGQYDADKLLNIGLNRWSFKPELGVSKTWERWTYELVTGVTFYTDNDEFLVDSTREQDPLFATQAHVIYSLGKNAWAAFDGTYYAGGTTTLDGRVNDDRQSNSRLGLTLSMSVTPQQSFKLYASTGATARIGGDFTTAGIVWQYRWGGRAS